MRPAAPHAWIWLGLTGCAVALLLPGCMAPQPAPVGVEMDPTRVEARDDVTEIVQYWRPMPWLYDADKRPVGFQTVVIFVSGETGRGAFVSGTILVWLYELEAGPDGVAQRKLAHGWEFNESDATPYRVRKRSIQGYYYGFPLVWAAEALDLAGRDIEIVFGYERKDGRIMTAPGKRFAGPDRVPLPPHYHEAPGPTSRPTSHPVAPPGAAERDARPAVQREAGRRS